MSGNATGIAIDEEGQVYISDSNNHRIMEFAPLDLEAVE